jgi:D-alanyl-D-alanine carboxypeptidase
MRVRHLIAAALLVTILTDVPARAAAGGWPEISQDLGRYAAEMAQLGRFNGVVLVATKSGTYRGAFGYANLEQRVPNVLKTQFEIASLTKMFTAAAILKLRDRHALTLEDSICEYLSPCPAAWQPVTIDEVLHHRSGIPDYEDSLGIESQDYYDFMTAADSSKRIVEREAALPLDFPPGTKLSYSNTGYVVLGFIIEKASHESYASFLHETIFGPAAMSDTGVLGVDPAPRLATGYVATTTWQQKLLGFALQDVHASPVPTLSLTSPEGDAGIFSTADDLLRWSRIMLGDRPDLLTQDERAEILQPVDGYGDGWMIGKSFGVLRFRHTGELPGFLSNIEVYPDSQTIAIVMDNFDTPLSAFTRDIQAIALSQPYDDPFSGALVTLQPAQQALLVGQYKSDDDSDIVCIAVDKSSMLEAAIKGEFTAGLLPFAPDRFYMPLSSGQVTFTGGADGRISELNMRYDGMDHRAARVDAPCPPDTPL